MTFNEALEFKKEYGETKEIDGLNHNIFIVPLTPIELSEYTGNYAESRGEVNDSTAKQYSKNNKYQVCGLRIVEYGNVMIKYLAE